MSIFEFKCAESEEHVNEANLQTEDIMAIFEFTEHFNVPMTSNGNDVRRMCESTDHKGRHNLAHKLMDELVAAYDAGHPILNDEMFGEVFKELKQRQEECREGKAHV